MGSLHVWSKVLEQHPTVCGTWLAGHGSSLRSQGQREVTSYGGIDFRLAHQLPGKPAEGHAPLSRVESSDLKLEQSLVGAWGKYVGRSVMRVGCRLVRDWSSRGCTENKRTAILGGLTIHLCTRINMRKCTKRLTYLLMPSVSIHLKHTYNLLYNFSKQNRHGLRLMQLVV